MGKRKIGMYGGKFIPVHMGYVYAMIKASTMVEELHVIVSYDEEYEKEHYYHHSHIEAIPYKIRLRWWKQITKTCRMSMCMPSMNRRLVNFPIGNLERKE